MRLKKFHIIVLMTLGLLMSPALSFACGSKDGRQHKKPSAQAFVRECCGEKQPSTRCGENHKDCGGRCGHPSCNCLSLPPSGYATVPRAEYELGFIEAIIENLHFGYIEAFFKSAINSLRLPPKIR